MAVSLLPIYDDPDGEHARLDRLIRARLKQLNRTEAQFNLQVGISYQTSSKWNDLSIGTKVELLEYLDRKVNQQAA
jgi:hypothetical protein